MCDNPANVRVFGIRDAERRCRALAQFFVPVLRGLYRRGVVLGAFREDALVDHPWKEWAGDGGDAGEFAG